MTRVCTLLDHHEHKVVEYSWSDGGSLAAIGGRDNSIFLFRALGKILYCKRETTSDREGGEGEGEGAPRGSAVALPPHLRHHQRPRLLVDPEWVVEHSHLSPEMFILYLHQNYLHMHSDIDNIVSLCVCYACAHRLYGEQSEPTSIISIERHCSSFTL
jgi:cell cycle checkpoint protein